jgi:acyl-CoA dehydrogenase
MRSEFADAFGRILSNCCSTSAVRKIEHGGDPGAIWAELAHTGFLDALVPESANGAGLEMQDAGGIIELAGRYLIPVAFAETMVARALLARGGIQYPDGPIVLGQRTRERGSQMSIRASALGATAAYVLVDDGDLVLMATHDAHPDRVGTRYDLAACFTWQTPQPVARVEKGDANLSALGAAISAMHITGALRRVLEMTIDYASERKQFGRPIGKFQAIQQNIALFSEHLGAATLGAQLAFAAARPSVLHAGAAKIVAGEAVRIGVPIAHAVHAALGVSEEHDLQLYTRRLHAWRAEWGAESHWAEIVGRARLRSRASSTADFIRREIGCDTVTG